MDDVQLLADLTVRHAQEIGQQDHIPLALRQLRQGVSQKIAGHDYRKSQHFKDMLAHISGKQPMSLQLTSGSGEQTKNEAALWLNQEVENLTLLSYSYCITGTSKPADKAAAPCPA